MSPDVCKNLGRLNTPTSIINKRMSLYSKQKYTTCQTLKSFSLNNFGSDAPQKDFSIITAVNDILSTRTKGHKSHSGCTTAEEKNGAIKLSDKLIVISVLNKSAEVEQCIIELCPC